MPQNNGNAIQDFLTPEAMLTPGVAGSLTMMITNALAVNFDASRAWTGLVLSFIFGLLVLVSSKQLLHKLVFYVLNSLVIFCVAVGANGLGGTKPDRGASLVSTAFAQTAAPTDPATQKQALEHCANISATVDAAQKRGARADEILNILKPCQTLSQDILTGNKTIGHDVTKQNTNTFFAPWRF